MMPRHFTEEINYQRVAEFYAHTASMMPRHFTEEIQSRRRNGIGYILALQ